MSKGKTIGTWILSGLLALAFLGAGGAKLSGAPEMIQNFEGFGLPIWFMYLTGAIEVAAAALLLIPKLAPIGAGLLIPTMIGAVLAHLSVAHPIGQMAPSIVLGLLTTGLLYLRRDRLKALLPGGAEAVTA